MSIEDCMRSENSQIVKGKDKRTGLEYVEYREDISKTNAGGLKDRKIQGKITRAYENIADKRRCIVRLYEKYIDLSLYRQIKQYVCCF